MKHHQKIWLTLCLLMMLPAVNAEPMTVLTVGEAFDLETNVSLYSEAHCVSSASMAREVIYRNAQQQYIAHKSLRYDTGQTTPSFVQQNFYSGELIAVELQQDKLMISVNKQGSKPSANRMSIKPDSSLPLVIDAGFDAFVTQHWDTLVSGSSKRFQFPFAARESLIELRIESAPCSYDSDTDQCFRLQLDNWLLAMLIDPIELGYDSSQRHLTRFRGLSNIGDDQGNGQVVDIRYRYQQLDSLLCETGDPQMPLSQPNSSLLLGESAQWPL